jgi:hypothetical protein
MLSLETLLSKNASCNELRFEANVSCRYGGRLINVLISDKLLVIPSTFASSRMIRSNWGAATWVWRSSSVTRVHKFEAPQAAIIV